MFIIYGKDIIMFKNIRRDKNDYEAICKNLEK